MTETTARTTAWWVWLLGQAGVLALYASGTPLSGGYPTSVEATASLGLAILQLVLGALLAPTLFADRQSIWNATWIGLLCQAIAGRLAGNAAMEIVPLAATVGVWLAIAGISSHWPTARLALFFAVIAGPVLFYSQLEYANASTSPHFWAWAWSPTVGIDSTPPHQAPFLSLIVGFAVLAAVLIGRRVEKLIRATAATGR